MSTKDISLDDGIFVFETVMRVRNTELDIGQHISIEALTAMLSEARSRFLFSKNIKEINADYQGPMTKDMILNLVSRVRAREELLFEVGIARLDNEGGEMLIKVTRMYDGSLVAKAKLFFVNYNYRLNKEIAMSTQLSKALAQQAFEL